MRVNLYFLAIFLHPSDLLIPIFDWFNHLPTLLLPFKSFEKQTSSQDKGVSIRFVVVLLGYLKRIINSQARSCCFSFQVLILWFFFLYGFCLFFGIFIRVFLGLLCSFKVEIFLYDLLVMILMIFVVLIYLWQK